MPHAVRRVLPWAGLLLLMLASAARSQAPSAPFVFAVEPITPGPVRQMIAAEAIGAPGAGRYFVLDMRGVSCEARIVRSRALVSSMLVSGTPPHQYELEVVGARACWDSGPHGNAPPHVIAVGPLAS